MRVEPVDDVGRQPEGSDRRAAEPSGYLVSAADFFGLSAGFR
jgi:hypothetical protein